MIMLDVPLLGAPDDLTTAERERWARAVDLGRAAAAGNRNARADLARLHGGAVRDDRGVHLYLDQSGLADLAGTGKVHIRRLRDAGRLIEAEVRAGRSEGYSIARAIMWCVEFGYMSPELVRLEMRRGHTAPVDGLDLDGRPWWRFDTVAYLTQSEAAAVLRIKPNSLYSSRMRGAGPLEAVKIGAIAAWDRPTLGAFNARRPPTRRADLDEAPAELA